MKKPTKTVKKGKSKVAAAPLKSKVAESKKNVNPLFEKRPKNFGIGKNQLFKLNFNTFRNCYDDRLYCEKIHEHFSIKTSIWLSTIPIQISDQFNYSNLFLSFFLFRSKCSAQAWLDPIRQVAEIHSPAETQVYLVEETQDPSIDQPVLFNLGQTNRWVLVNSWIWFICKT